MISRRHVLLTGLACILARPASAAIAKGLSLPPAPAPLPAIAITEASGATVGLADLAGRPALLNLWASWCAPCVTELPALDRLAAAQSRVAVMALCLDRGGAATAKAALERVGVHTLPLRLDSDRRAAVAWSVATLPTTLLLDAQGREVGRYVGAARWDGPEAAPLLNALADGKPLSSALAPPPLSLNPETGSLP